MLGPNYAAPEAYLDGRYRQSEGREVRISGEIYLQRLLFEVVSRGFALMETLQFGRLEDVQDVQEALIDCFRRDLQEAAVRMQALGIIENASVANLTLTEQYGIRIDDATGEYQGWPELYRPFVPDLPDHTPDVSSALIGPEASEGEG